MKINNQYKYTLDKNISKEFLRLGFGSFQIGGITKLGDKILNMGEQKSIDSERAIKKAIKLGINFFDTSDIYGNGKSEKLLGRHLSKNKTNFTVCTKYGNRMRNNKYFFDHSIDYTNNCVNNSKKRLKIKSIDILLLHSPPNNITLNIEFIKNIKNLKQNNQIKSFGISCRDVNGAINFVKKYKFIDYIEVIYNIIDRRIEDTLAALCKKNKVKIIAKVPLASGLLSKKNLNKSFGKNDIRYGYDKNFIEWVKKMHQKMNFLKNKNHSLIASSLRYVLTNKSIAVVIPGMRNEIQVEKNFNSFLQGPLNKREILKINKLPKYYPGWK